VLQFNVHRLLNPAILLLYIIRPQIMFNLIFIIIIIIRRLMIMRYEVVSHTLNVTRHMT